VSIDFRTLSAENTAAGSASLLVRARHREPALCVLWGAALCAKGGDSDGNGRTDVFLATGSEWRVSWDGSSSWLHLNTSGCRADSWRFGDFDGDGPFAPRREPKVAMLTIVDKWH
jgi:hypothetical protein